MAARDPRQLLTDFGFTSLESEIYAFLLRESPATGYRIAQAIGKPAANTYKAIQTLEAKGAVLVEVSGTKRVRAVPAADLLDRIGKQFAKRRAEAVAGLESLGKPAMDDRIYVLKSKEQAIQRVETMLAESKELVIGLINADWMPELEDARAEAASRDVEVLLTASNLREVRVAVDGSQALLVDVGRTEVSGFWSRSAAFAVAVHRGIAAEWTLHDVQAQIEDGGGAKRVQRAIAGLKRAEDTLGYRQLGAQGTL